MSKSIGLRTEILTTLTLLMGAALLLGGVLMLRLTEQSLLEQKVAQLRLMTGTIGRSLEDGHISDGQGIPFAMETLKQLPDELLISGWWLYGADLQLLAAFRNGNSTPYPSSRRQQSKLTGEPYENVVFPSLLKILHTDGSRAHFGLPLYQRGRFLGLLEINYSLEDIRYRLLLSQRVILVYVLLYGAVLVFVGYYLLQRNVIQPARNLLRATEDVSRGHLDTRLPVAGPTEIARLADAYNHMVEALQESRHETQVHIASLEQTNQELQRTRDELIRSEKLASVGQLAAGLAHELGNPLAALIGYLDILQGQLQDDKAEVAHRASIEAERIDYLVREMLNFSRPSEDATELLDPVAVLRSAVCLLLNQGAFGSVELLDQLSDQVPPAMVRINKNKLQQLFINLLLNAVHATSGSGQIILAAEIGTEQIGLVIKDNGCGIDNDQLGKIFDPFFTTKPPGEGTGLGLSVCHRIVEEVGGQIHVESQLGQGSCFVVALPKIA